jgi:anti-sigma regulatory factor (Ser/Thr protein kinase)
MREFSITAWEDLTAGTFEASVHWRLDSAEERLVVNLRALIRAELFALVQLLTIMTAARDNGAKVFVYLPSREHVRREQAELGFYEMFPDGVWTDRAPPGRTGGAGWVDHLVPFARLNVDEGGAGIDRVANMAYESLPHNSREGFTEAMVELGQNVIDHSEAEVGFIAAIRRGVKLELVVGDAGIGIRESLARRPDAPTFDSDFEAVKYALEEETTSKPGQNSGLGLPTVWTFTERFSGSLYIRTGKVLAMLDALYGPEARSVVGLQGTIVGATLGRDWDR